MAFFRKSKDAEYDALAAGPAMDPHWAEHEEGGFLRFTDLDPEEMGLSGASGVYVLWHGGFRPEWVYVGHDKNLASAMHRAAGNKDIMTYDDPTPLSVTWSLVREEYQAGVVKYLTTMLDPQVDNPQAAKGDVKPIPVLPPGMKPINLDED